MGKVVKYKKSLNSRSALGEEDISTEQYSPKKDPRVPEAHVHEGRTLSPKAQEGQGEEETGGRGERILRSHLARDGNPSERGHSLGKEERIRRRSDYARIWREGKRRQTEHFLVSLMPNSLPFPRLGIVVSKRVGQAVERNRLKRRIREFFRLHKEAFPGSSDVVITAKRGAATASYWQISSELKGILEER